VTEPASLLAPALSQAQLGLGEGGIPIGSAMFIDDRLVGGGRNQRVQQSDPILHAEMHCLQQVGRLSAEQYRRATLVSTLSPCDMCTGAILLFGIPRVIVGENRNFFGGEDLLRARGVEVTLLDDAACIDMMASFIQANPELWNEDIAR